MGFVRTLFLGALILSCALVGQAVNAQTYSFGSTNTSTTGNYSLALDTYGMATYVEEYRNGFYQGKVYVNGSPPAYSGRTNGSYEYRFIFEMGPICIEFYGCDYSHASASYLGSTYVPVQLPPPPSAPTPPTFTYLSHASISSDKEGSFTVNWVAPSGSPTRYELQQRFNSGSWSTVYNSSGTSLSRSVGNGTYDYRVRACNAYGCSSFSAIRTVTVIKTPSIPGSFAGPTTDPDGSYGISWGASSGVVSKYTLQERTNGGTFATVQDASSLGRSISGKASAVYDYRVRACNSLSCSGWTALKTVTISIAPGTPSSISASSLLSDGSLTVSWGASSGPVDAYRLYREANGSGTWSHVYTGSARSYGQSSLANGSYKYRETVQATKTTYGPQRNIVHVKDKLNGGTYP
ncbi:fibronectin type III domain-containing protein [Proteobacteria bacterium 005FR1]|nr:fibronectin type III domain-containing protein [Proteobacteria bacterium 005FR1]